MRLILFLLFSTIEFGSIFLLTFSLFLFQIRSNLSRIVFASLFLAQVSFLIREELNLNSYAPMILVVVLLIFIWLLFRVQFFYSAIMTVVGYTACVLIQFLIFILYSKLFKLFTLDEALSDHVYGYLIQSSSSLIVILLSIALIRKRIGFTFVPDDIRNSLVQLKKENLPFLIIIFIALTLLSTMYYLKDSYSSHFIVLGLLLLLTFLMLLYLAFRKEGSHD